MCDLFLKMAETTQNICNKEGCDQLGVSRCSRCKDAHYCSKECQKSDWKIHKKICKKPSLPSAKEPKTNGSTTFKDNTDMKSQLLEAYSDKTGWSKCLSYKERHEWFVDCYRMRIDDDYVWGGGNLHGLYDSDIQGCSSHEKKIHVIKDFLVYTKLAVKNKVIPADKNQFSFDEYLKSAAGLLGYAFEKSDAKEKWGGENVFSTRPSLRRTAEYVYGSSCMEMESDESEESEIVHSTVEYGVKFNIKTSSLAIFLEVGGLDLWVKLFREMKML